MAPESMVHALKQIHGMLKEDGRLIDIHPIGEPPPIYVRLDNARHLAGWVQESSDYAKFSQADDALKTAVQRGWFQVEQRQQIVSATYAPELAALQDHLKENWRDAWIEDLVAMQIESLINSLAPHKEIIIEDKIWLSRLTPMRE